MRGMCDFPRDQLTRALVGRAEGVRAGAEQCRAGPYPLWCLLVQINNVLAPPLNLPRPKEELPLPPSPTPTIPLVLALFE